MRWLVWPLVLLAARVTVAGVCTGKDDQSVCVLADGVTSGECSNQSCVRNYTVPAGEARTGTGTISSSGSTVTGSGTVFTTELHVGDMVTASGQMQAVSNIVSHTSLQTAFGFAPVIAGGSAFTYTNPIASWLDSNGNTVAVL